LDSPFPITCGKTGESSDRTLAQKAKSDYCLDGEPQIPEDAQCPNFSEQFAPTFDPSIIEIVSTWPTERAKKQARILDVSGQWAWLYE